jgi:hypothetical protein
MWEGWLDRGLGQRGVNFGLDARQKMMRRVAGAAIPYPSA